MQPIQQNSAPARVLFGIDTINQLADEVARLPAVRALIISTKQQREQAQQIAELLGDKCAATFTSAAMHTPVEVTADALL